MVYFYFSADTIKAILDDQIFSSLFLQFAITDNMVHTFQIPVSPDCNNYAAWN